MVESKSKIGIEKIHSSIREYFLHSVELYCREHSVTYKKIDSQVCNLSNIDNFDFVISCMKQNLSQEIGARLLRDGHIVFGIQSDEDTRVVSVSCEFNFLPFFSEVEEKL